MPDAVVSYSNQDREAAKFVLDVLTEAGLKIVHPGSIAPGENWQDQIQAQMETASCFIVLWSAAAAQSPWVQQEIQQAIQAWSASRLILATLDDAPLPVGLRDLQAIPLRPGPNGLTTTELVKRAKAIVNQQVRPASEPPLESVRAQGSVQLRSSRWRVWLIAAVVVAVVVLGWGWYQISTPKFESRGPHLPTEQPSSYAPTSLLILLILGIAIGAGSTWAWSRWSRRRGERARPDGVGPIIAHGGSRAPAHVFISYSRLDDREVERLVKEIERAGYTVWIDREASGSQRYAGSIVRAIKTSDMVALMCSQNAFSSDHVIREVYVAGDFKKPFIAFQLDRAEFPDDVEYFVSGFPRISVTALDPQRLRSEISRLATLPASGSRVQ